ncbi:MAG: diaminopimelate epimerase [Aestuariivita sp.]|nr:diaminopimelate epimerase [Aestuariivita sp.]
MNILENRGIPFIKMHGLGNDFVVIDARTKNINVSKNLAQKISDRHCGVGFDQLAIIKSSTNDIHLSFFNQDGSISATCGNATRCIARYLMDETGKDQIMLKSDYGSLEARDIGNRLTSVNMGTPEIHWSKIPLINDVDTKNLPIDGTPTATGLGNPHCSFFVSNTDNVPLEEFGKFYETHPLFPERTNVQVAQIIDKENIRVRVWERGVGITSASASSAGAVTIAAVRRGLCDRRVHVTLDGGVLSVEWSENGVWVTGPTMEVFHGTLTPEFLEPSL